MSIVGAMIAVPAVRAELAPVRQTARAECAKMAPVLRPVVKTGFSMAMKPEQIVGVTAKGVVSGRDAIPDQIARAESVKTVSAWPQRVTTPYVTVMNPTLTAVEHVSPVWKVSCAETPPIA